MQVFTDRSEVWSRTQLSIGLLESPHDLPIKRALIKRMTALRKRHRVK
jgi:hypothetical protein